MKKILSFFLAVSMICGLVATSIAATIEPFVLGELYYCPVCGHETAWYDTCSNNTVGTSSYSHHTTKSGQSCNYYTVTVRDARVCTNCGNKYLYSSTHTHIIHEICANVYNCR